MRTVVALWGVAMICATTSARAQKLGPEPKKKRAAFVADSNDAVALYNAGLRLIDRTPSDAAAAFYWAARINPAYAEPLYGLRAAMMLRDPMMTNRMYEQRDRKPSKEVLQLDSLLLRALSINPFLYRRYDRTLLVAAFRANVEQSMHTSSEQIPSGQLDYLIEKSLADAGPGPKAWLAYSEARFDDAIDTYRSMLKSAKDKSPIRIEIARIFAMRANADSAIAEFDLALAEMRKKDQKELVLLYNSKALLEHSIATLLESKDDYDGARAAYGRALQEDLAFYPAHVRLGLLALQRNDTTTSLGELELAAQVAADEPFVRFSYGYALASAQQLDRALVELTKAAELEPLYARPHAIIGMIWEHKSNAAKAAASYEAFLARASQNDPQRSAITERLADVKLFIRPPS